MPIQYDQWIERERRTRLRLLLDSPVIMKTRIFRVCVVCGEICLCAEVSCPNCNDRSISEKRLEDSRENLLKRINCMYRFKSLRIDT